MAHSTVIPPRFLSTTGRLHPHPHPPAPQDAAFALPSFGCPADKKLVDLKCISGDPLGFASCPTGFKSCFLSSWHRPLCAVATDKLFGVDSCTLFETLAFAHKLPKVACPAA